MTTSNSTQSSTVEWECLWCGEVNTTERCHLCKHTDACGTHIFCHHAATGGDAPCTCRADDHVEKLTNTEHPVDRQGEER